MHAGWVSGEDAQHGPRAKDNTVFVDEDFDLFPDQWAYLAGVQRIAPSTVERVAAYAQQSGQVLGVRTSGLEEEDAWAPWLIPPSRRSALVAPTVKEPVPTRVEATLAQRLFISKAGLPSSLINALRRIAAFQHPDFYQKQRLQRNADRGGPLHPSTHDALGSYLAIRTRTGGPDDHLFVLSTGGPPAPATVTDTFIKLARRTGLRGGPGEPGPRPHDLRHSCVSLPYELAA